MLKRPGFKPELLKFRVKPQSLCRPYRPKPQPPPPKTKPACCNPCSQCRLCTCQCEICLDCRPCRCPQPSCSCDENPHCICGPCKHCKGCVCGCSNCKRNCDLCICLPLPEGYRPEIRITEDEQPSRTSQPYHPAEPCQQEPYHRPEPCPPEPCCPPTPCPEPCPCPVEPPRPVVYASSPYENVCSPDCCQEEEDDECVCSRCSHCKGCKCKCRRCKKRCDHCGCARLSQDPKICAKSNIVDNGCKYKYMFILMNICTHCPVQKFQIYVDLHAAFTDRNGKLVCLDQDDIAISASPLESNPEYDGKHCTKLLDDCQRLLPGNIKISVNLSSIPSDWSINPIPITVTGRVNCENILISTCVEGECN